MLKVTICYQDNNITGFKVKGHANFAPEGQDICCAGVSAVTQTALIGLLNHLEEKPEYKVVKGDLEIKLPPNISRKDNEIAQIILDTMVAGLKAMQEEYREFIKMDIRRC